MKVNRKVSEFLGQTKWRPVLADGNYLAYIPDIKARIDRDFLAHPEEVAAAIGGVLLSDREAAEEQKGTKCRSLPIATDPRFVMDIPILTPPEDDSEGTASGVEGDESDNSDKSDGSDGSAEEQPEEVTVPDEEEEGGEA